MSVRVSESRIPLTDQWMYRVFIDGKLKDLITTREPWTFDMVRDVTGYYTESLIGYEFDGEPSVNPTIRKPVFQNRRRTVRAVE